MARHYKAVPAKRAGVCAVDLCRERYPAGTWVRRVFDRSRDGYGTAQWGHTGCIRRLGDQLAERGEAPRTRAGEPRNAMDLVLYYSNASGWGPDADWTDTFSHWQQLRAGKFTRAMRERPGARSMPYMVKAVDLVLRRGKPLRGAPTRVLPLIADRLFLLRPKTPTWSYRGRELEALRESLIAVEMARPEQERDEQWLSTLVRLNNLEFLPVLLGEREAAGLPVSEV
jgi:hypothetical protein